MKSGLYLKLSVNGIKKNKKLYLPYLITCICMVMMFYLIDYLAVSPQFAKIKGGDTMQMILGFGSGVISIFSLILLYYTNSFLIRRRQREFGLYHILGMGKIDLVKIMVLENLIISVLLTMIQKKLPKYVNAKPYDIQVLELSLQMLCLYHHS